MLFGLPTAQLASRMKERFKGVSNIDVDTCAAAFGFLDQKTLVSYALAPYTLAAVDETPQLSAEQFRKKSIACAGKLISFAFVVIDFK